MERVTVGAGGTDLYYQDVGTGPPVVFVHGFSGNHLTWYRQVPSVAEDYRALVPDQRGFGLTRDTAGLGVAAFAEDLVDLLDGLEVEEVALVGHSMGGWTVGSVATQYPERVSALALEASPGGLLEPDRHRRLMAEADPVPEVDPLTPEERFLDESIDGLNVESPAEWEGTRAVLDELPLDPEPVREAGVPALVLAGEADEFMPPAAVEATAEALDAETVTVEGAGHTAHFERPEAVTDAVLGFLDDHHR